MESRCFPEARCLFQSAPVPAVDQALKRKLEAAQQLKVLLDMRHIFRKPFETIVCANLCKYNRQSDGNWLTRRFKSLVTVAEVRALDPDRVLIRRRMSAGGSAESRGCEDIIVDRKEQRIEMFLHEDGQPDIREHCSYHASEGGTAYRLLSFKLKTSALLRRKIFHWGVGRLEGAIKEIEQEKPK